MAKKKKKAAATTEHFYFTVDDWCHQYVYGINRTRRDLFPSNIMEINSIRIIGRLRNATKRKIDTGELWLSCMDDIGDELNEDAEDIGTAWIEGRHLKCSALLPLIVFHSFPATLAAGKVREFHVTVRNLRYNSGDTDSFSLHRSLSDLADSGETDRTMPDAPAKFDSLERS